MRQLGGSERDTVRLEKFSDGVFAIAITLLILDIRRLDANKPKAQPWPRSFGKGSPYAAHGFHPAGVS